MTVHSVEERGGGPGPEEGGGGSATRGSQESLRWSRIDRHRASQEVSDREGREERVPVAVFLSLPEVGPARSERGSGGKSAGPRISGVAHRTLRLSGGEALEKERRVALARGVCFSSVLKVWPVRKAVGGE